MRFGVTKGEVALGWARPGREQRARGLCGRLEDEEGHGRGRCWQPLPLPSEGCAEWQQGSGVTSGRNGGFYFKAMTEVSVGARLGDDRLLFLALLGLQPWGLRL